MIDLTVTVNGQEHQKQVEPRRLLVHFLRETLGLTGTNVGCETSLCGACTVLVDGVAVKSCTQLAVQADGTSITTVEGLAQEGELHPLQKGFWEKHGLQCGYCTPGMLVTALDYLERGGTADRTAIRAEISGNYCRCTGYEAIVDAVESVAQQRAGKAKP